MAKKSGGTREILAPIPPILYMQQKLLYVLHEVYVPRPSVHGAVRNESILTNALPHKKARFLINLDLKDFFPSVHFGRVLGLLCSQPYGLPLEGACRHLPSWRSCVRLYTHPVGQELIRVKSPQIMDAGPVPIFPQYGDGGDSRRGQNNRPGG